MYWVELYQEFRTELRAYTAVATITPREFMRWASEAVNQMQERTDYIEQSASLTIPANQGTLSTPVAYPATWRHIKSVYDDASMVDYGIAEFYQYKRLMEAVNPSQNVQRQIPPVPRAYFADQDYTAWCSFFNEQVYVYPSPSTDLALTVHFVPTFPIFSAAEASWSAWNIGSSDDTNFNTEFSTQTPPREFFNFGRVIVDFCKAKWLWTVGTEDAMRQAARLDASFEQKIKEMLQLRKGDTRRSTVMYRMGL